MLVWPEPGHRTISYILADIDADDVMKISPFWSDDIELGGLHAL